MVHVVKNEDENKLSTIKKFVLVEIYFLGLPVITYLVYYLV